MSVCLEFSSADLSNNDIGAHIYFLKGPLHQKETSSHVTKFNIIYPHKHCHRFKGLEELFLLYSPDT
jgi:hypothetical protein